MPIGVAADGTTYHINSDLLAGRLARALEAEKLVLMTNIAGVQGRDGKIVHILTAVATPTSCCATTSSTAAWSRA